MKVRVVIRYKDADADWQDITHDTEMPQLPSRGMDLIFGPDEHGLRFSPQFWEVGWVDDLRMYRILIHTILDPNSEYYQEERRRLQYLKTSWKG